MDFTVVIPSRNRPMLLRAALDSVLAQTHERVEILVVNDGSDGENEQAYAGLAQELSGQVRFLNLEHTPNGHGPSGAINRGVAKATGEFITFLDDDDYWTDTDHLARAWKGLADGDADAYYSNQVAYFGEKKILGPLWLEGLDEIVKAHDSADTNGIYTATKSDLMECEGFAHLNTTIVRRSLYTDIGAMDEAIRYECEWDLFFRIVDHARKIRFHPAMVSRHNAPDPSKSANVSTAISMLQKMLYRAYVLDKAILFAGSPHVIRKAKAHKIYTLKNITDLLVKEKKFGQAYFYARQAHVSPFDIKWFLYSCYLSARRIV